MVYEPLADTHLNRSRFIFFIEMLAQTLVHADGGKVKWEVIKIVNEENWKGVLWH